MGALLCTHTALPCPLPHMRQVTAGFLVGAVSGAVRHSFAALTDPETPVQSHDPLREAESQGSAALSSSTAFAQRNARSASDSK